MYLIILLSLHYLNNIGLSPPDNDLAALIVMTIFPSRFMPEVPLNKDNSLEVDCNISDDRERAEKLARRLLQLMPHLVPIVYMHMEKMAAWDMYHKNRKASLN